MSRSRGTGKALRALLWAGCVMGAADAKADDWSLKIGARTSGIFDSNLQRVPDNEREAYGTANSLTADLLANTATFDYGVSGNLAFQRYGGPGATDSYDSFYGGAGFVLAKKTKLSDYDFTARIQAEPTSTTELEDSGLVQIDSTRLNYFSSIGASHALSDRHAFNWSLSAQRLDYTSSTSLLSPSNDFRLSGGISNQITELTKVGVDLGAGWYNADNARQSESATGRLTAYVTTRMSPRMDLSARAGLGVSHNSFLEGPVFARNRESDNSANALFAVELNYRLKMSSYSLSAKQDFAPSSLGDLQLRTTVSAAANYKLTKQSSVSLSASYFDQRDQANGTQLVDSDRSVFTISPAYSYAFARNWTSSLSYRFILEDDVDGNSKSNIVQLTVGRDFLILP